MLRIQVFAWCDSHVLLCSNVYNDRESAESAALTLAEDIASKSPVAVQGSKVNLNYSRDHPVDLALEYAVSIMVQGLALYVIVGLSHSKATWNGAMLQTEDIIKAVQANVQKEKPVFAKL